MHRSIEAPLCFGQGLKDDSFSKLHNYDYNPIFKSCGLLSGCSSADMYLDGMSHGLRCPMSPARDDPGAALKR